MEQLLIVEDDIGLNQGLCKALKVDDRKVISCKDLKTAKEQLLCGGVSLILLDINLPDGSGLELLREVKETTPGIPVILLTANDTDPESWYSLIGKKKLENLIGQLHAKGHHKLYINENGQIYIQNGDTAEIKDCFDYFPPRNYWDILISIFQKDELTAKEKDQALELSWIKE